MTKLTRRQMLRCAALTSTALALSPRLRPLFASPEKRWFKIGACDWSIGKMGDPAAMHVAKQIGLDGVQVSPGTAADNLRLRKPERQQEYKEAVKTTGVLVASLAIGELNETPFKSDVRTVEWVSDCIDVCQALGCRTMLLAFFGKGDLRGDKTGVDEVVRRLKTLAPKAEKAGVVLGIESWLSARDHMDIIQRVGSPSVQVYYDVANSTERGYDIFQEIRWLGRERICEFHMKENGALLGQGRIDFKQVRAVIDEIGFSGWLQIEGSVPQGGQMLESYIANRKFLRNIFPPVL